jgi:hypothetical protein
MKRTHFLLVALSLAAACGSDREAPAPRASAQPEAAGDSAVQPAADERLWLTWEGGEGEITASTTEAMLIQRFGAGNVSREEVYLAEGETAQGTVLFANDSTRRLEVVWADSTRARPQLAIVRGRRSLWTVAPHITLGTPADELERLNGRPFVFNGFDWDYGGAIISWEGGQLEGLGVGTGRVFLVLSPPEQIRVTEEEYRTVTGEREVRSDNDIVRRLNPWVEEITIGFEPPEAESRR